VATRFYLPYTASATPITPAIDTEWRAFGGTRSMTSNVPVANTLTNTNWIGGDSGNGSSGYDPDGRWHTYVCYKQFISPPLAAQTIPANTPWTLQCQIDKLTAGAGSAGTNNDGHYLMFRGSLIAPDNIGAYNNWIGEATNAASGGSQVMQNRTISGGSGIARTILNGSRIVLEIGVHSSYPSQPYGVAQHSLRFGYNVAGWLPSGNNTDISTTLSPWWELNRDLLFQREMTAAKTSFSLVGRWAELRYKQILAYRMSASKGEFLLGGEQAEFKPPIRLAASSAAFVLSGKSVALVKHTRLTAEARAFTLSGKDVNLVPDRKIAAAVGQYTLSGQIATFQKQSLIDAGIGTFTLGGQDATLEQRGAFMNAEVGAYILNGQNANLTTVIASQGTGSMAWLLINGAKRGNF
jgi:hypothetical protein